jgi:hypothetical protein
MSAKSTITRDEMADDYPRLSLSVWQVADLSTEFSR